MKVRMKIFLAFALSLMLSSCSNEDNSSGVIPLPETTTTTLTSEQSVTTTTTTLTEPTTTSTTSVSDLTESSVSSSAVTTTTTTTVTTKTPTTTTTKKVTTTTIKVSAYDAIMYANCVANVRSGNGTQYDIVHTVKKNTTIRITGICENGWYKVTVNDIEGYMSSTVLSEEKVTTTTTTTTKKPETTNTTTKKPVQTGQVDSEKDLEEAYKMVELVNELRAENGLPKLEIDERIMEAARIRSEELSEQFSHTRPNGESGGSAIWDAFGDDWYLMWHTGENIAMNNGSGAQYTFNEFCKSDGHRKTMLGSEFSLVGIGFYTVYDNTYGELTYCCQLFGGYHE